MLEGIKIGETVVIETLMINLPLKSNQTVHRDTKIKLGWDLGQKDYQSSIIPKYTLLPNTTQTHLEPSLAFKPHTSTHHP